MTSKMCKDQGNVAFLGLETQNVSRDEIHTDVQISGSHLYAL